MKGTIPPEPIYRHLTDDSGRTNLVKNPSHTNKSGKRVPYLCCPACLNFILGNYHFCKNSPCRIKHYCPFHFSFLYYKYLLVRSNSKTKCHQQINQKRLNKCWLFIRHQATSTSSLFTIEAIVERLIPNDLAIVP